MRTLVLRVNFQCANHGFNPVGFYPRLEECYCKLAQIFWVSYHSMHNMFCRICQHFDINNPIVNDCIPVWLNPPVHPIYISWYEQGRLNDKTIKNSKKRCYLTLVECIEIYSLYKVLLLGVGHVLHRLPLISLQKNVAPLKIRGILFFGFRISDFHYSRF